MAVRDCAAVLVTYHPDLDHLREVLAATVPQVDRVIVIDNGSPADLEAILEDFIAGGRVVVRRLGQNFGIAHAHNRGFEEILASGYAWALVLDQDSVPAPDMVARLVEATRAAQASGVRVAAAGPRSVDPRTGRHAHFLRLGGSRLQKVDCPSAAPATFIVVDWLISSGMLIAAPVLRDVGLTLERLFIDDVDTEWCLRARAKGYQCIAACAATMQHTLGARAIEVRLGRQRHIHVHSPIRLYYIMRNALLLARMPHVGWRWWLANAKRLSLQFVVFSAFVGPRLKNLGMMLRGIRDGILDVGGPYGERTIRR